MQRQARAQGEYKSHGEETGEPLAAGKIREKVPRKRRRGRRTRLAQDKKKNWKQFGD